MRRRPLHRSFYRLFVTSGLLVCALFMVHTSVAQAIASSPNAVRFGGATILLVHGFNGNGDRLYGSSSGDNCTNTQSANSMAKIANYIKGKNHGVGGGTWTGKVLSIGYYKGDNHCDVNLHQAANSHCKNYYFSGIDDPYAETGPAADGTNNESIYRLSCLLAWYIYDNYGIHPGWNIELVGYSMGGLIIRNALFQVAQKKAPKDFPPSLGSISDVVTLSTPHGGIASAAPTTRICSKDIYIGSEFIESISCTQLTQMISGSYLMNELANQANADQAHGTGSTDWTLMGSDCDSIVSESSALWMIGGRKSVFVAENNAPCYSHDGSSDAITQDDLDWRDAVIYYCDGCGRPPSVPIGWGWGGWTRWGAAPRSLYHMMHSLWLDSW